MNSQLQPGRKAPGSTGRRIPAWPHRGRLTHREAILVQERLAGQVVVGPSPPRIRYVAGLDAAFTDDGRMCLAAAVLWDVELGRVEEQSVAARRVQMPYIPGLLSFREAPALLAALRKLVRLPDALLCDGQGIAHPRRFGVACHVGVLCNLPSVGCAKNRLIGDAREPGGGRGEWSPLMVGSEQVGCVLRARSGVKPLYVSVGHRFDLAGARALVLACSGGFRVPEPTRLADLVVGEAKRGWRGES